MITTFGSGRLRVPVRHNMIQVGHLVRRMVAGRAGWMLELQDNSWGYPPPWMRRLATDMHHWPTLADAKRALTNR